MSTPKKDSGVEWFGEIPAHWEIKKLKHVATLRTGRTPPGGVADHVDAEGISWITPDQLSPEIGIVGTPVNIKVHQGIAIGISKAGSLLLCCIGASIGKFGYARQDVCTNQQINSATFGNSTAPNFRKFLGDLIGLQLIASANKVTLPICNKWQTGEVYVPHPPLSEQRAIADYLDAETERIDSLVANQSRLVDLLRERRQAIITQAVTKGLDDGVAMRDSGIEWLGEIPAHWQVAPVNRYYSVQLGKMLQNSPAAPGDSEIPYLKAQHVQWFQVKTIDAPTMWANRDDLDKYRVVPGDLLVCEGGEGGRCGIVNRIEGVYIIQNALHRVRARNGGSNGFLQYVLSSVAASNWFDVLNDKATIAHFTNEKFKALLIPIPPLPEQRAIADYLDAETARIDTLVSKLQRQTELLTERRQAVITAAVTGKLDVMDGSLIKEKGVML